MPKFNFGNKMPKFNFGDKMPKKPLEELPDDTVIVLDDKQDFSDFEAAFAAANKKDKGGDN